MCWFSRLSSGCPMLLPVRFNVLRMFLPLASYFRVLLNVFQLLAAFFLLAF
jgi:hypothetical protein